jgi:pyruvate kinase
VRNPRPTRAEASDVANAVFDGTDAVMLSAETATGKYPVASVKMMVRIIESAEKSRSYQLGIGPRGEKGPRTSVTDVIGEAACGAALELGAKGIVVFTQSGGTALLVARYRPYVPIFAFTPIPQVARRLALVWGLRPWIAPEFDNTDEMISNVVEQLKRKKGVRRGDTLVITAGTPVGRAGTTNFLKAHRVE